MRHELKLVDTTELGQSPPRRVPDPCRLIPPRHLRGMARKEWKRVAAELLKARYAVQLDRPTLEYYCVMYARATQLDQAIGTATLVNGKVNPLMDASRRCWADVRAAVAALGFSPASRVRLSLPVIPKPGEDDQD